ncbi:MAG: hypothetical protein JXL84_22610 [Deltaproteobacteria bacterium]|nr:hypothetical protein [Deltaproteobacteria bacterium]
MDAVNLLLRIALRACLIRKHPVSGQGISYHKSSANANVNRRLKLSRVKDCMLTSEGGRMAAERHAFMETFFERFLKECEGHL